MRRVRRVLLVLSLALLGGAAAAGVRRLAGARPAGTPTSWPAVPRKPLG